MVNDFMTTFHKQFFEAQFIIPTVHTSAGAA